MTSVAVHTGLGCKRCGCRRAVPCRDLCARCYEGSVSGFKQFQEGRKFSTNQCNPWPTDLGLVMEWEAVNGQT